MPRVSTLMTLINCVVVASINPGGRVVEGVGENVGVRVLVGVGVGERVGVTVGVAVGVSVTVGVIEIVGVGVESTKFGYLIKIVPDIEGLFVH
jgi:hypothetical protein